MNDLLNDDPMNQKELLGTLADAIADVGYWAWWVSNLPDKFQIEFGGTQLYIASGDNNDPPITKIALQFLDPISISFISRDDKDDNWEWVDLLHNASLDPPTCSYEEFYFGNNPDAEKALGEIKQSKNIFGDAPTKESLFNAPVSLVFWCWNKGLAITAQNMKLFSYTGEITLNEVPNLNKKWWSYWQEYWDKKKSGIPLPKDYACEVTIPAG